MNKNDLYRLSALLYPNDENRLNRSTIIKKILESFFVINNNRVEKLNNLPTLISNQLLFLFSLNELVTIIKQCDCFVISKNDKSDWEIDTSEVTLSLSDKRYKFLNSRANKNSISIHIEEFYNNSKYKDSSNSCEYVKSIIESFLYHVFVLNIEKGKQLLSHNLDISSFVTTKDFKKHENIIINDFLDYDSDKKNKAIFDIGSLAIEYVSINGNINLASQLNTITQKIIYLDTNVIFRALGIDGETERNTMKDFLYKCYSVGQEIRISYTTNLEFFASFDYSLSLLNPISKKQVFSKPLENNAVKYYFELKKSGQTTNIELYKHLVLQRYEKLKKKLKIKVEANDYYATASGSVRTEIDLVQSNLKLFKNTSKKRCLADATNLVYIHNLRGENNTKLNNTRFFLITTDRGLSKWDSINTKPLPISLLPSDWLSVLLKYVSRGKDDYKSFVSFIKTVIHDETINNENSLAILDGISDIVERLESQEYVYDIFVSDNFHAFEGLTDYKEIHDTASTITKAYFEETIDELKSKIDSAIKGQNDTLIEHSLALKKIDEESRKKDNTFNLLKKVTKRDYYLAIISSTLLLVFGFLFLIFTYFYQDWQFNFIYKLTTFLFSLSDKKFDALAVWFCIAPLIIIGFSLKCLYKNLFGSKTYRNRILILKAEIESSSDKDI